MMWQSRGNENEKEISYTPEVELGELQSRLAGLMMFGVQAQEQMLDLFEEM